MIGLIIRFKDKAHMDVFVNETLTDLFQPMLPLQTRPADSNDPKELFVLNQGRDGR
tara:strand:+ start:252 stop:419 length:168 start_codon:yes stop_codon:yes gene_type:complete